MLSSEDIRELNCEPRSLLRCQTEDYCEIVMMLDFSNLINSLDWPNLLGGAILGAVFGFLTWLLPRIYDTWVASKDLPYPISGVWYSVEYDPKVAEHSERNTLTKVKVRRALGARFRIRVVEQIAKQNKRPPTAWRFVGRLRGGDTLVGSWSSTVKDTKRFGAAVIKFIDYGRAVGYWIGPVGRDYPTYGYWIMARKQKDVESLATSALEDSGFGFVDVANHVLEQQPSYNEDIKTQVQQQHAADGTAVPLTQSLCAEEMQN